MYMFKRIYAKVNKKSIEKRRGSALYDTFKENAYAQFCLVSNNICFFWFLFVCLFVFCLFVFILFWCCFLCVWGVWCVGFWLQSGICFGFYPGKWGHTAKWGYPQFLVSAVYSITGAIGCVNAPHLAIGGNVASCPVKSLNSLIIYRSTGVNWGHHRSTGCPHLLGV